MIIYTTLYTTNLYSSFAKHLLVAEVFGELISLIEYYQDSLRCVYKANHLQLCNSVIVGWIKRKAGSMTFKKIENSV